MKKLSSRMVAALTNVFLVCVVFVIGAVCFLPNAKTASRVQDRVCYKGNSENGVSLMFNVYWGTEEVYEILDILDGYEAKATFFLGGSWADDNGDCVKTIAERGHEIGSHGYFHREHDKLNLEGNYSEIKTSVDFLSLISGQKVLLFAPPSGAYNENTVNAAESLGLKTVMWSKDTIDWRDKDADLCYRRATKDAKGGDLVLMHPMAHTVEALPRILEYYRVNGLKLITVSENLA